MKKILKNIKEKISFIIITILLLLILLIIAMTVNKLTWDVLVGYTQIIYNLGLTGAILYFTYKTFKQTKGQVDIDTKIKDTKLTLLDLFERSGAILTSNMKFRNQATKYLGEYRDEIKILNESTPKNDKRIEDLNNEIQNIEKKLKENRAENKEMYEIHKNIKIKSDFLKSL